MKVRVVGEKGGGKTTEEKRYDVDLGFTRYLVYIGINC